MSRSTLEYLRHILDEADYLLDQAENISKDKFSKDETLKRAFVRSFEIMGEAVKNIPDDFKQKHTDIEWRSIAAMRDRLIHRYFGIDYDIVWDAVKNKVPKLQSAIKKLIEQEQESDSE